MASVIYRTEMRIVRRFGHKRVFGLPEPELHRWLASQVECRSTAVPRLVRLTHKVCDQQVAGRPCPIITPHSGSARERGNNTRYGDGSARVYVGGNVERGESTSRHSGSNTRNGSDTERRGNNTSKPGKHGGGNACKSSGGGHAASERVTIQGSRVCARKTPVVLFLHGGGFIYEALFAHWLAVSRIVRKTEAEVWFAAYPLLPKATVYDAHEMVLATWKQMCTRHAADAITVLGDSAGAMLALTLTHALKAAGSPLPRQLILCSPAQSLIDDNIRAQMAAFAPLDVMIPLSFLDVMARLTPARAGTPAWLQRPLEGDFRGFPPTMALSGTREIFYPLMPNFLDNLLRDGVPTEFVSGEGMCHDWPYVPVAPECVRALDHIIAAIR
jgi:acetyl esterase/lipase